MSGKNTKCLARQIQQPIPKLGILNFHSFLTNQIDFDEKVIINKHITQNVTIDEIENKL